MIVNQKNRSDEYRAIEQIVSRNPTLEYRQIATKINFQFNTDYWDSERIRDRVRKYRKAKNKILENMPEVKKEVKSIGSKRILVMADGHFPSHREDLTTHFENHILEVDAVVFAGDMFDNQALSSFTEIAKRSFEDDLISFYWFIKGLMDKNTNNVPVYFIRGNHEERLARYIASNQQNELNKFLNPQIMQMFADGFCIYEGFKKIEYPPISNIVYVNNWFLNINDSILICHQKDFNKPKLKTVCNGIDYFFECGEKFDAIFLAHMHTSGYTKHMNKHGYNIPCMCKPQEYSNNGKFQYKPQSYGYTIVETDNNGKFNVNNTKIIHLDELYERINEEVEYKVKI
jgi:predicted phosphodiesterase